MKRSRMCIDCGTNIDLLDKRTSRCDECRVTHSRQYRRDWQRQKKGIQTSLSCKRCGTVVERVYKVQRYCLDCSPYAVGRTKPQCIDCGQVEVKRRGTRCAPCGKINKANYQRERNPPKPPRFIECGRCGKTIEVKSGNQKWCSDCGRLVNLDKLKAKYWADPAAHAESVRQWFQNRIATDDEFRVKEWAARYERKRKLGSADEETVAYMAILRNDPCSYCGAPPPSTIDHIYPTSKGGLHHWSNMTAACHHCNASKKVRTDLLIWMLERKELRSTTETRLAA